MKVVLACVLDKTRYFALLSCKWQYSQTSRKRPLRWLLKRGGLLGELIPYWVTILLH